MRKGQSQSQSAQVNRQGLEFYSSIIPLGIAGHWHRLFRLAVTWHQSGLSDYLRACQHSSVSPAEPVYFVGIASHG
jgi:hypothetical protein